MFSLFLSIDRPKSLRFQFIGKLKTYYGTHWEGNENQNQILDKITVHVFNSTTNITRQKRLIRQAMNNRSFSSFSNKYRHFLRMKNSRSVYEETYIRICWYHMYMKTMYTTKEKYSFNCSIEELNYLWSLFCVSFLVIILILFIK